MFSDLVFHVCCVRCGKSLGALSESEYRFLEKDSFDHALCFDCDEQECDQFPAFFSDRVNGEQLTIGDVCFFWDSSVLRYFPDSRARAHVSARAPGLSSSTYLNRNTIRMGVSGEDREYGECLECKGLGWVTSGGEENECFCCDGQGEIVKALFLPLWLVNGVRENA